MTETIVETSDFALLQESADEQKDIKFLVESVDDKKDLNLKPKIDTESEHHDDQDFTDFDAFTDENNQIYRTYQLRKTDKITSRIIDEEDTDLSSDYEVPKKIIKQGNEKVYKCSICSLVVENQVSLTTHMHKHISKNIYTCLNCQDTFDTNNELLDHNKTHDNEEKCYLCKKCKQAFSNELVFIKHGFAHIKTGPFKCPICLVISTEKNSIKHHISTHFYTKQACVICNKLVAKNNVSSHMLSHISVKCEECGKNCTNKATYEYHLTTHTGVKLHQCLYCGRGFSNSGQKRIHMKLHTGEKAFECKICFQKFTQQSTKDKHEHTHNAKKIYECDFCGKKFKNKAYMKYHLRIHYNDKPYQCPNCPRTFITSGHLTSHTYTTHLGRLFKCDLCNLEFSLKKSYTRHLTCKAHQKNAFRMKIKSQENEE